MTVTESVWCAKPARLSSATATYGFSTMPTNATPIIISAPTVKAPRRALISPMPAYFCSVMLIVPPNMQPRSAARNGSHANIAICFRSNPRTVVR